MVTFEVINKDNVNQIDVKSMVQAFSPKAKSGTNPDYVQASIESGEAIMLLILEDYEYVGFFVLHESIDEHDTKGILVWLAYAPKPLSDKTIDETMDYIREIASNTGAEKIVFRTKRKGWQRRAERYGFKESERTYEIEV
ncbi:hypothetical protein [Alteromonas mediterranea]|uniref:N-acetyltransferase domain-containing protein n=1 Tax=Alteromonas mediterranea (strain DSM 17117 / CIP 110805 / LMG 28347 / Deep ecotype) TaxID=1774373 RepID=F2GC94_ALTMD|nr:hypothetical protein [Alteromonas mediterranea]AEA99050.1 hypothetical protein MADE_1014580 [Alteromonas mediterranea DE]